MRVLLTGASGLLGRYLLKTQPLGMDIYPTYYENKMQGDAICMNLQNKSDVFYAFNVSEPQIVIHCAGMASVDLCKRMPTTSREINVRGTQWMLEAAKEYGATFVYVSTNTVFSGQTPPYSEHFARIPVNEYGLQKKDAEDHVRGYPHPWTIIRPILLYGKPWSWGRGNWATRVMESLCHKTNMTVVDDTMTQPTYAGACAEAIWKTIETERMGTLHVGGADKMNLYEFCTAAMDVFGRGEKILIEPVSSDAFPDIAPRPRDTTYDLRSMKSMGLEPMGVEEGLERMRQEYE